VIECEICATSLIWRSSFLHFSSSFAKKQARTITIAAIVSIGAAAATAEQEYITADVLLGAATTEQEPEAISAATPVSLDADVALDAADVAFDTAVAQEVTVMATAPTNNGMEEATKGF
jgi:hypothetical protein